MRTFHQERIEQLPSSFIDTINSIIGIVMDIDDVGKVIMFGSCSRGTHTDNSDIDLLLLLDSEKSGMPFNRLEQKVGTEIYERFSFNGKRDIDLLFADENVYINSTDPRSVYQRVKRDGVVLYEQLL